jgi:hypothetical protein
MEDKLDIDARELDLFDSRLTELERYLGIEGLDLDTF